MEMDTASCYSIVHFYDDESVEPSFWFKDKLCAWPKNKALIMKFIVTKHVPNNREFKYFRARELSKGIGIVIHYYNRNPITMYFKQ